MRGSGSGPWLLCWWLFAPSPQQGINLADGTLVMPAQGRDEKGKEFSTVMTSSDRGVTWTVGTPAFSGGSECQAVQLGDGSVMLNIRNEHERFRAVFVSRDLGRTASVAVFPVTDETTVGGYILIGGWL